LQLVAGPFGILILQYLNEQLKQQLKQVVIYELAQIPHQAVLIHVL
jgi:hypothetical protein